MLLSYKPTRAPNVQPLNCAKGEHSLTTLALFVRFLTDFIALWIEYWTTTVRLKLGTLLSSIHFLFEATIYVVYLARGGIQVLGSSLSSRFKAGKENRERCPARGIEEEGEAEYVQHLNKPITPVAREEA